MKVTKEPEAELSVSVDAMVTVLLPTTIGAVKPVTINSSEPAPSQGNRRLSAEGLTLVKME
jgi:hypothetical protein